MVFRRFSLCKLRLAPAPSFKRPRMAAKLSRKRAIILICAFLCEASVPFVAHADPACWVGTWAASPQPPIARAIPSYRDQTLRLIVHASLGGQNARIVLSNRYGSEPVRVGAARIALRRRDDSIEAASDRELLFRGARTVSVSPHQDVVSDPVNLDIPPGADLAVSLYLPDPVIVGTTHVLAKQTGYVAGPGDQTGASNLPGARTIRSWPFLSRVDVTAGRRAAALVLFGDSLIDGDGSSADTNARWGDDLAARFRTAGVEVGVLNAGLIGNSLLRGSPAASQPDIGNAFGPAGVDRAEADALSLPGVRWMIVRFGTNDLAIPGSLAPLSEAVSARQLADGFMRLLSLARRHHVQVLASTIPPYEGAAIAPNFHTAQKEMVRLEFNRWLRSSRAFDGLIDADRILRDAQHPSRLSPALDSGDHIHPNDAGYRLLAEAFPLNFVSSNHLTCQREGS